MRAKCDGPSTRNSIIAATMRQIALITPHEINDADPDP